MNKQLTNNESNLPITTTLSTYITVLNIALQAQHIDTDDLIKKAGLDIDFLDKNIGHRISYSTINELFLVAVELTDNPYFAIEASQYMQPKHWHALGTSLLSSETLLDFLYKLASFSKFVTSNFYVEDEGDVVVSCYELGEEIGDDVGDIFWSFLLRFMRHLSFSKLSPIKVELCRDMPVDGDEPYQQLCQCPVSFSQSKISLYFNRHDLIKPLYTSNESLSKSSEEIMKSYYYSEMEHDYLARVKNLISQALHQQSLTVESIANFMGVTSRTLKYQLSKHGYNFSDLVEEVRAELAKRFLANPQMSLNDIAERLNYNSQSSFSRAFTRWFAMSPNAYRAYHSK